MAEQTGVLEVTNYEPIPELNGLQVTRAEDLDATIDNPRAQEQGRVSFRVNSMNDLAQRVDQVIARDPIQGLGGIMFLGAVEGDPEHAIVLREDQVRAVASGESNSTVQA